MSNKSIYFLTISLIKGGAENQLVKLAISLKNDSYQVKIIGFRKQNDFEEALRVAGIPFIVFNINSFLGIYSLLKFLNTKKPDVMISFMYGANVIGRLVRLVFSVPLITSVRNIVISKKFVWIYKFTRNIDSFTVFNSEYALRKFIDKSITNRSKSLVINNAISLPSKSLQSQSKENDVFTLTSLAHFRPQKDYLTLFKAIKILKDKQIPVRLFCLGHLYGQSWPEELVAKLGLNEEIKLMGFLDSTEDYIGRSDVLVLSSLWEGTPNALLEAMANEIPIISSRIPGCEDLVQKSGAGLLFNPGSAQDLAGVIEELLKMEAKRKMDMGKRGRTFIMDNFSENKIYEEWKALITKL